MDAYKLETIAYVTQLRRIGASKSYFLDQRGHAVGRNPAAVPPLPVHPTDAQAYDEMKEKTPVEYRVNKC